MDNASSQIQFLSACYESDNRQTGITSLFHKSIRHLHFIDGEDHLLCGLLSRTAMSHAGARATHADALMYRREKSLLYCALPIIGALPAKGLRRASVLCAPLLFYPAVLCEDQTGFSLEIDLAQQQVNLPVLAELAADRPAGGESDVDELIREFPQSPLSADRLQGLIALIQDFLPHLDALALTKFPMLDGEAELRRMMGRVSKQPGRLTCLPACALALAPNSHNARGVLFELNQLAECKSLSQPLKSVLGHRPSRPMASPKNKSTRVPVVLSQPQKDVLHSASTARLTLVVGPPGTGKSYTIGAIAVDHIGRGESVLVACRKQQAVDVVAKMIESMLGPNQCVIRGGESRHVRELKTFLGELLQGIRQQIRGSRSSKRKSPSTFRRQRDLDRQIARVESALLQQFEQELRWGQFAVQPSGNALGNLWNGLRKAWLQRRLLKQPALWQRFDEYHEALQSSNHQTKELLKQRIADRMDRTLKEHRRDLTKLLDSLRTRSSSRQERLFSEIDLSLLFNTFPVWLTTVTDAAELIPLETEIFDVAIFDEATQCDMASALPILQRAKRGVVVGDPKQLRHISFLSRDRQEHLAAQYQLNQDQQQQLRYREKSLLDLVDESIASQDNVHFLNEHFRSLPQIISFSNQHFYQNALSIMRESPKSENTQSVFACFVADGAKTKGVNASEARAIAEKISALVESQQDLPSAACQSIGVLSPFRDQVDLIARELETLLALDAFSRHDIRVGTAHAFQGDERDVMLLSFVIDTEAHHSSIRFLDNENLLNVSITRARHEQHVYHSVAAKDLPSDSLLRQYLESIQASTRTVKESLTREDAFLRDVRTSLENEGIHVSTDYELAGVTIDLIAQQQQQLLGIDLIGYPGHYHAALDLERYRILRRAGFALFPLPYRNWQAQKADCVRAIIDTLQRS